MIERKLREFRAIDYARIGELTKKAGYATICEFVCKENAGEWSLAEMEGFLKEEIKEMDVIEDAVRASVLGERDYS